MKSDTRLPFPKSTSSHLRTHLVSLTKTQMKESEVRHEYHTQFSYLAKMVESGLGSLSYSINGGNSCRNSEESQGLFERGRFYEQYSARRDERLRKKQEDPKPVYSSGLGLGVKFESGKKKPSFSGDSSQNHRYPLRSTTSMIKKPSASRARRIC